MDEEVLDSLELNKDYIKSLYKKDKETFDGPVDRNSDSDYKSRKSISGSSPRNSAPNIPFLENVIKQTVSHNRNQIEKEDYKNKYNNNNKGNNNYNNSKPRYKYDPYYSAVGKKKNVHYSKNLNTHSVEEPDDPILQTKIDSIFGELFSDIKQDRIPLHNSNEKDELRQEETVHDKEFEDDSIPEILTKHQVRGRGRVGSRVFDEKKDKELLSKLSNEYGVNLKVYK
ncbi:hypothetical protein DLAC_10002 [Tieghemostelium lacteum]|uniref:Uncharacterized protein n=1 Tax=Tieghemostelium lacteum TaxID=361077 RepID=A0A151Z5V7_TIELA|nr:hypothetical protein DLAC_10002 [Tieghemostelium lacteum]|eukprot:KYQ89339.1 hypothetical protein DLAC_10002 [Tieghemostelium lacteum]